MRKYFLALALFIAGPCFAQSVVIPVLDPTNFVVANKVTLAQLGNSTYNIIVPNSQQSLALDIPFNAHADGISLSVFCSPDNLANNSAGLPNGFTMWAFDNGSLPFFFYGTGTIALSPASVNRIEVPVQGCSVLEFFFFNPTGTLTDTVSVQGQFSPASMVPMLPGHWPMVMQAAVGPTGVPVPLQPLAGTYSHIVVTSATALGNSGVRSLHTVTVNTGAAGTFKIFDLPNGSCTGTPATNVIASITVTATTLQTFTYDIVTVNGLCVQASVVMDVTVSFQ